MTNNENFVAYEYKNITVKRDTVSMYKDCLGNFGWMVVDEENCIFHPAQTNDTAVNVPAVHRPVEIANGLDLVTLKFKRNRKISNKLELNRLEQQCEAALSAIGSLERKNEAYTMGTAIGAGIIGTGFLALAAYSFISASPVFGVLLTIIGIAGWGVGFFTYLKISRKKSAETEPMVQEQLNIVYAACEQAHALLA